ncbi:hypothetical protein [Planococcus halocryophilus]|uniref:hypothetical protein n=1 Tax=Planococcus halocryophilus TaxID=1215089 RepID=UPI001F0EA034|nr:hypothetical protein [Planococcus halocryophilus]MCH4826370.1 hypothetical protein [Planococcus halocryophilus]
MTEIRGSTETKFREEYARQVLLAIYSEKYLESSLADKPDIQNYNKHIGVEVTETMKQRLRYGVAQFSSLYNKHISEVTSKKKDQLKKHKIRLDTNNEGIIKFILPEAFWGGVNQSIEAFNNKLNKLNDGNYKIFKENNLFLYAEGEEEYEVIDLIKHIKESKKSNRKFDYIFVFTFKDLYAISTNDYSFEIFMITEEQRKNFSLEAAKVVIT